MSLNRIHVLTPWLASGSSYRPQLAADHPVQSWVDVTGQPAANIVPSPNLFTIEAVCDDATLAAIEADATYSVLWSEPL